MSKMMHDQPSAAVPASRDRRNFLIAGAGLALAATTLGRSGAVMAKPAGQDTPNAPSDAAPVRKETLTTRKRKRGNDPVNGVRQIANFQFRDFGIAK